MSEFLQAQQARMRPQVTPDQVLDLGLGPLSPDQLQVAKRIPGGGVAFNAQPGRTAELTGPALQAVLTAGAGGQAAQTAANAAQTAAGAAEKAAGNALTGGIAQGAGTAISGIANAIVAERNAARQIRFQREQAIKNRKHEKRLAREQQAQTAARDEIGVAKSQGQQTQQGVNTLISAFTNALR